MSITRERNFIIIVGDTFGRQINLRSGPEADIAEYSGEMIIYNDDKTVLLSATTSNARMVLHNGYIDVEIAKEIIEGISLSGLSRKGDIQEPAPACERPYTAFGALASYILRVESPTGIATTLLKGKICFSGV